MKVDIGKYRNIKVEIHEWDLWDMSHTISLVLLPLFQKWKEKDKRAIPCCMFENNETWEQGESKWHEIIDKIIWSLKEIATRMSSEPELPELTCDSNFNILWESEEQKNKFRNDIKEYNERLQEGLTLLGKHFQNFWS